jgi:photosystem II stability/assembly factor-like uncharacterized protein
MFLIKRASILLLCFVCLQTANAGWTKQVSGTFAWLHSVYFTNQNKGWIAGSRGTLLITDDGGKTWKQNQSFTQDNIRDVYFSDEKNGWLLCERDIYGGEGFSPSYLLKTSDGGANWEKAKIVGEGRERFARLFFSKNGNGFAVGESGAILGMQDDKKSWKKNSLPVPFLMLDGAFTDDLHGSLVGGSGTILFTEDGGLTWHPAAVGGTGKTKLNSVFFINQKIGWAVGAQGKVYATINGGKFWREQNSTVTKNLSDIFFINTAEGFAVGDDGTILHTTTAGNIWKEEETGVTHKLERIFFTGQKGFAVGFGGTILTYDAAQTNNKLRVQPQLQKRN